MINFSSEQITLLKRKDALETRFVCVDEFCEIILYTLKDQKRLT